MISATNKTFKFVCTIIISDISPKFLPVLSYIFFITCRLYCSFIKLCYPELPIPKISTLLIQLSKEGVNLIFKKGRILRQFLFNGVKKSARKKNVCYRVPYLNCHYSYIGETSQWWDEREKQHKRCIKNQDENNSFWQHLKQNPDHEIGWGQYHF